jgi:GAF domain-containing protein
VATEPAVNPAEESGLASWSVLERLGRILHVREAALQPTLDAIARAAVETIAAAQYAGVNLLDRGRLAPQAVVGQPPLALDVLQQETGMGPCIDAARDQVTVRIEDLAAGSPWPRYAELAISLGVRSVLCVPLWVDEQQLGSVSLHATAASGFTATDEVLAGLFGTQAALVLADASRAEQLRQAMATRDSIGQAKGILMERHRITADQAFAVLSEYSQRTNRKVAEVARHLAETGQLDLSPRRSASRMPGEEGIKPSKPVT